MNDPEICFEDLFKSRAKEFYYSLMIFITFLITENLFFFIVTYKRTKNIYFPIIEKLYHLANKLLVFKSLFYFVLLLLHSRVKLHCT